MIQPRSGRQSVPRLDSRRHAPRRPRPRRRRWCVALFWVPAGVAGPMGLLDLNGAIGTSHRARLTRVRSLYSMRLSSDDRALATGGPHDAGSGDIGSSVSLCSLGVTGVAGPANGADRRRSTPLAPAGSQFVGFDASEPLINALKAGKIEGLVVQNPLRMGELGVKTLVDHLEKKKVDQVIDTGETLVTPENMNDPKIAAAAQPARRTRTSAARASPAAARRSGGSWSSPRGRPTSSGRRSTPGR